MQASSSRRYRILDVLGSGGFGTVYRAEMMTPAGLRREVALKVLNDRAAADKEAAARLRDEARILSNLNYVGIVRVDDLILLQGRWTMVMELVHGVDLEKLIGMFGPLPPAVALEIVASVARTLHAATQAMGASGQLLGLIHRDIKPANILVSTGGMTKLLDFGVARAQLSEREASTQKAIVMGSLPYLAPERYGFEDLPAGDVYALGAVLYEALTGQRFGRTHLSEQRHREKLREALLKAWDVLLPEGREPLLRFCAKLLAYDPDTRPPAREVAQEAEALRQTLVMPGLASWAERRVVEALQRRGEPPVDSLCGEVLTEVSSQNTFAGAADEQDLSIVMPAPVVPEHLRRDRPAALSSGPLLEEPLPVVAEEQPPAPPQGRGSPWVIFGVALAVGALVSVGALLAARTERAPTSAVVTSTPFTLDDVAGLPFDVEEGALVEEAEGGEGGEEQGVTLAAPPQPSGASQAADAAPKRTLASGATAAGDPWKIRDPWAEQKPAAATQEGSVVVTGDIDYAQLLGEDGEKVYVGPVKPGTYTVFPSFRGGYTVKGPTVTVLAGQTVVVRCDAESRTCGEGVVER